MQLIKILQPFLSPKKLKKLRNNPAAFFEDAINKRVIPIKNQLNTLKPKKKHAFAEYYIISAVYNVEKYLEDYFDSILKQRLDFKNNIKIICVDDGSTDRSAEIIKGYQKRFPNNIVYLYKENGGQASARNMGIDYLQDKLRDKVECYAKTQRYFATAQYDKGVNIQYDKGINAQYKEINMQYDKLSQAHKGVNAKNSKALNCHSEAEAEESQKALESNKDLEANKPIWITFIDPDDFLSLDYFYEVDKFLEKNAATHLSLLLCHTMHYGKSFAPIPCLEYMFFKNRKLKITDLASTDILVFSNSFFFFLEIQSLRFDENCRPNFEDGKFNSEFLFQLDCDKSFVGFIASAKYFYRRHADNPNSSLSLSLSNPLKYTRVPKIGWLDVLQKAKVRYGFVPSYLQGEMLWELFWILSHSINKEWNTRHLNTEEKQEFLETLEEICKFIDIEYIQNHKALNHFYKLGITEFFKQQRYPYEIVSFEGYNVGFNDFHLSYYSRNDDFSECEIFFDKIQVKPYYTHLQESKIFDRVFLYEKNIWVKVPQGAREFEIFIRGKRANIQKDNLYYRKFLYVQKLIKKEVE